MNPKSIVLSNTEVKACLNETLAAQAKLNAGFEEFDVPLNPHEYKVAAVSLLDRAKSAAEIKSAQAKLNALSGDAARLAKDAAQRAIWRLSEVLKETLNPLLIAALKVVDVQLADAIKTEEAWFAKHHLPREATGVSKRWLVLQSELVQLRASLSPSPNQPLPRATRGVHGRIPAWFKAA